MSEETVDTSKEIVLLSVTLKDGKMDLMFNKIVNFALLSHALRLLNLNLDNAIIGSQQAAKPAIINTPNPGFMQKLRGGNGR